MMSVNTLIDYENDPEALEKLYRNQPEKFELELSYALKQKPDSITFRIWATRLSIEFSQKDDISPTPTLITVIGISILAGLTTRIPALFFREDWFYPRFAPFVALMATASYFLIKNNNGYLTRLVVIFCLITTCYLSLLPDWSTSSSITMLLIHLPLACWLITGIVFSNGRWQEKESRIRFIRYSGELAILSGLILIGGFGLTALTIGLFQVIGIELDDQFIETLLALGVPAIPVIGTYVYDVVLQKKIQLATILAKIFAPLFLVLVVAFILATAVQGIPFLDDRDYLIIFNALLIVILCIALFSIVGQDQSKETFIQRCIIISLIAATVFIDLIALYAISLRLLEFGFSINRFYIWTINILILGNLIYLLVAFAYSIQNNQRTSGMIDAVTNYLPIYALWVALATFILPLVFQFQ